MLLPTLVPSSSNYDFLSAGKLALTYRLSIEIDIRRAAGCMQRAGGYVSLRCNIGGEFGEPATAGSTYLFCTASDVSLAHSYELRDSFQRQPMQPWAYQQHHLLECLAKFMARSSAYLGNTADIHAKTSLMQSN
jgi:hypothetical protein